MIASPSRPAPDPTPLVFAHLVPWFKTEDFSGRWEMWKSDYEQAPHDPRIIHACGRRDIATTSYPLNDVYDSSDPDLIEYQCLLMRLSGIDGVIIDWDGLRINPYRHEAMMCIIPHLQTYGLKLIVCLEEWCGYWPPRSFPSREAELAEAQRNIDWLTRNLLCLPHYAVVRGRKPVLIFRKVPSQWFSPPEWDRLAPRLTDEGAAVIFDEAMDAACPDSSAGRYYWVGGFFPVLNYNSLDQGREQYRLFLEQAQAARSQRDSLITIGAAVPGFDDSPVWGWGEGARVAPHGNGRRFREGWELSLRHRPDLVQLITWNDWNEGSQIEPADTYGYRYLEMNKRYAAQYKATPDEVPDQALRVPLALYQARKRERHDPAARMRCDQVRDALLHGDYACALAWLEASSAAGCPALV